MNRRAPHHPSPRSRPLYAVLILLVIGTGLLWRSGFLPLPASVAKYGGDGLWAIVVFLGFGFLLRTTPTMGIAIIALCGAWAVEFSQLYHAPWLDTIRMTTPGRLVLGSTFNGPDLAAAFSCHNPAADILQFEVVDFESVPVAMFGWQARH